MRDSPQLKGFLDECVLLHIAIYFPLFITGFLFIPLIFHFLADDTVFRWAGLSMFWRN